VAYSSQFTYGADGLRRRSLVTSNGVTNVVDTVYDAGMPVEEVGYAQGTNTPYVSAMYLIGPRGPEYRRDVVHQSVAWYVYDGLGSVVEEVDPSGNITASRKYDVYGLVRSGQAGSSSQKYVGGLGHESEGNTGLIYMRARYMDPVLGRFLSEDPSKDGANWFVYCEDEPVDRIDDNGKVDFMEDLQGSTLFFLGLCFLYAAAYGGPAAWKAAEEAAAGGLEWIWETLDAVVGQTVAAGALSSGYWEAIGASAVAFLKAVKQVLSDAIQANILEAFVPAGQIIFLCVVGYDLMLLGALKWIDAEQDK